MCLMACEARCEDRSARQTKGDNLKLDKREGRSDSDPWQASSTLKRTLDELIKTWKVMMEEKHFGTPRFKRSQQIRQHVRGTKIKNSV